MKTEIIDKLFLELSQFTSAKTRREIELEMQVELFKAAAKPIVRALVCVDDSAEDETDRVLVYSWNEIYPLQMAIENGTP